MNMQTPVISMANLSVAFFGRTVLNGIDLEIPGNSITIIIGPSGSGKTTLLRAVILSAGQMIKTLERRELETPGLLEGLVDEIF